MAIQWGFIPSHITGLQSKQHAIWWNKVSVNTPRHSLSVPRLTKIIQWIMCGRPPLLLVNYEVAATEGQSADIDELSINILASNPSHHFLVLKSLTPHTCWSLSDARLSLDKFHNQENKDKHVQYICHSTQPANNRPHVGDIRSDALPAPKDHG